MPVSVADLFIPIKWVPGLPIPALLINIINCTWVNHITCLLILISPGWHQESSPGIHNPSWSGHRDPAWIWGVQPPLWVFEEPGLLLRLPHHAGRSLRRGCSPLLHPRLHYVLPAGGGVSVLGLTFLCKLLHQTPRHTCEESSDMTDSETERLVQGS